VVDSRAKQRPYFVAVGTIEPRKNILMLLNIWRRLAVRRNPQMPHLFLVGRRGWDIASEAAMLDRCIHLAPHVTECSAMTNVELETLLIGSKGLLFPSFAEGFGLPLIEAAGLGIPIIASDLAVFREIVSENVEFIDPLDANAWEESIMRAIDPPKKLPAPRLREGFCDWITQSERFADFVELRLNAMLARSR
jgi:glycosyltransferase involved in cell wall biosynthesis